MAVSPPISEGSYDRLTEAAKTFLAVALECGLQEVPGMRERPDLARGMAVAMCFQALGKSQSHPPGTEFTGLVRAMGLGFGGLMTEFDDAERQYAVTLFNAGLEYALSHSLQGAPPAGSA